MEKISTSRDAAENKLLILYILFKVNMAVGSMDLTDYVLEKRLMEFILFRQYINELIGTSHVESVSTGGGPHYAITGKGMALLEKMIDLLPATEKNRVDRTINIFGRQVVDKQSVVACYIPEDEHGGVVHIELNEGRLTLLSMDVSVASRDEARLIMSNWKAGTKEIYSGIIEKLLDMTGMDPVNPDENGGDCITGG